MFFLQVHSETRQRLAPCTAFAALVWLAVALLSLPLATMAGRTMPRVTAGLPVGQMPNQSEEESESWPKSEVRHTTPSSGTGGPRGRRAGVYRLASSPKIHGSAKTGRGDRPPGCSQWLTCNGTGGPLRC